MQNPLPLDATRVSSSQDLTQFLTTARHLRSLIENENSIFLENGEFNLENYVRRKIDLMKSFEDEAQNLLKTWGEDEKNPMRLRLLQEIEHISRVMRENSLQQLAVMKAHRSAKYAALTADKEDTCH